MGPKGDEARHVVRQAIGSREEKERIHHGISRRRVYTNAGDFTL